MMKLAWPWKREAEPKNIIAQINAENRKQMVDFYVQNHLPKTDGLIIVWLEDERVYADYEGLDKMEAVGALEMAKDLIKEGLV